MIMKKIVLAGLALALIGCGTPPYNDVLAVREALLRQSILYCTSQLNFSREKSAELQAGLVGTTIVGKASLTEFWQGALLDKEFRDHLLKEGVSANDFQNVVSGANTMNFQGRATTI